jgi:hypothetical protein
LAEAARYCQGTTGVVPEQSATPQKDGLGGRVLQRAKELHKPNVANVTIGMPVKLPGTQGEPDQLGYMNGEWNAGLVRVKNPAESSGNYAMALKGFSH